jgi:hypothetical protein
VLKEISGGGPVPDSQIERAHDHEIDDGALVVGDDPIAELADCLVPHTIQVSQAGLPLAVATLSRHQMR